VTSKDKKRRGGKKAGWCRGGWMRCRGTLAFKREEALRPPKDEQGDSAGSGVGIETNSKRN
jgi:hypothetical protein